MHNERAIWTSWLLALTGTLATTIPATAQQVETPSFESRFVEANGIRLQYMDFGGSGLPLIFVQDIHNYFEDEEPYFRDLWSGFYARFTDDHHVLATVKRGYGESDDPGWGYDVATHSEDLLGMMDALGYRRAVLVGRVPATQDLTWIAEHHPDRVAGLVYLGNPVVLQSGQDPEARLFGDNYARGSCDLQERGVALGGARTSWRPHFLDDKTVRIDVLALRFTHPVYDRRSMDLQRLDRLDEIAAAEPGCPGEARSLEYFRALAADADRRAALRQVLEESDPSVPIDEGMERAFGAGMRTVREPDLEGGWPAFHDFIEPHFRTFLEDVQPKQGGGDTVFVAAPTHDRETDRASIHAALEQVEPGGTIAFEPGTYLVGGINLDVAVPGITLVGHPDGTTLRGCDPEVFEDYEIAMFACNALRLSGGHQTVRGLTFEYAWHGLTVGCCLPADLEQLQSGEWRPEPKRPGGDTIEDNTFRYTPNGLRVMGRSSEPTVIRGNRFMDVYHAIGINGGGVHFLDNRIRAEQPHRVPTSTHPGDAINISPAGGPGDNTTCSDNVVAGNRIEGHTHGIRIAVNAPDTSCRQNVVVANRIVVERVPFVTRWFGIPVGDEADFTVAGVPLSLVNYPMLDPKTDGRPQPDRTPAIEDNVIEGNEIIGGYGLGIEVVHASRNRIADNAIRGIRARDPFPGNVLLNEYVGWRGANGSGLWVSPGSDGNEVVGNTFEDLADAAVVVEGDNNRVSLRSAGDAVRDLGSGNQIEGPTDRGRQPAATDYAPAHTVYDAETFFDTEIVFPARWDRGVFSQDERRVLVGSDRTGTFNAFAIPVDGGEPDQLTHAVEGSVLRVREMDGSSTGLTAAEDVRVEFLGCSADGSAFRVATDERARPVMDVYFTISPTRPRATSFADIAGLTPCTGMSALYEFEIDGDAMIVTPIDGPCPVRDTDGQPLTLNRMLMRPAGNAGGDGGDTD